MSDHTPEDQRDTSPENAVRDSGRSTDHTIGAAEVTFEGLFAPKGIDDAVRQSWVPGHSKDLYRRHWILTKILDESDRGYFGKIGFVREDEVNTLLFDSEKGDFVEGQAPTGVSVPFFLSRDGRIAFQIISNTVRETAFLRAFSDLMNSSGAHFDWVLTPLSYEVGYDEWMQSVERIVRFDFTLDRPNPHYGDDDLIERLVEETRVEHLRLAGSVSGDGQVDVDSDPFRQALDHVSRNYGRATITGVDEKNEETVWTKLKGVGSRTLVKVRTRGRGSQASQEELVQALSSLPVGSAPVSMDGAPDEIAG